MVKKIGNRIELIIQYLFVFSMMCIIGATIFIDKTIQNKSMNTLPYPNVLYYCISILVLMVIFVALKKNFQISDKLTWTVVGVVFVLVIVWQWKLSYWVPDLPEMKGDFGWIKGAAKGLAQGHNLGEYSYFKKSKNNINVVFYLSYIYRIVKDWRIVIFIGALGTNIAALFVALTVKECVNDNRYMILALLGSEMLLALTWRAFIVYTDNFAMPYVAIALFVLMSKLSDKWKIPLFMIAISIAAFIKITCLIIVLALIPEAILSCIRKDKKQTLIRWCYCIACFTVVMGCSMFLQKGLIKKYQYTTSRDVKGWQFMFMVGQNDENYGVNNQDDKLLRQKYIQESTTNEELNALCLEEAIRRVKERGLSNVIFYLDKANIIYGDGYFDKVKTINVHDGSRKADIYVEGGYFYEMFYTLLQVIWFSVLLMMLLGYIFGEKNLIPLFYPIAVMGITLYTLLFEGRSKYLYMLLPVFIIFAFLCLHAIIVKSKEKKRSLVKADE